jgi:hypothetical protein
LPSKFKAQSPLSYDLARKQSQEAKHKKAIYFIDFEQGWVKRQKF